MRAVPAGGVHVVSVRLCVSPSLTITLPAAIDVDAAFHRLESSGLSEVAPSASQPRCLVDASTSSECRGCRAGACSAADYPLQKKRHGLEFLRTVAHLRGRTNVIGAIMRVRSALAQATHSFFASHGFLYVHTPIISASDCEGAGEMFQVRSPPAVRAFDRCGAVLKPVTSALDCDITVELLHARALHAAVPPGPPGWHRRCLAVAQDDSLCGVLLVLLVAAMLSVASMWPSHPRP